MDNSSSSRKLAQFSQLQQSQTLNDQITNLLAAQAAMQGTTLLGHIVDFTNPAGPDPERVRSRPSPSHPASPRCRS